MVILDQWPYWNMDETANWWCSFEQILQKMVEYTISGNISHLCLPAKSFGLNISAAKQVCNNCKLSMRRILKTSINPGACKPFNLTMNKNAKIDDVAISAGNLPIFRFKNVCDNTLKKENWDAIWEKFMGLNEQCKISSFINDEAFVSDITNWKKVTNKLLAKIFRFCRRYLVFSLANNSNPHRWKISKYGLNSLCNKIQTQLHVFNNCKQAYLDHYTSRHDSILFAITEHQ